MSDRHRELKKWDNFSHEPWDLTEESRKANPEHVGGYGRNAFSYQPELYALSAVYWRENEAKLVLGNPATWYL